MSPKRLTALIPAHNDDYCLDLCLRSAAPHFDEVVVLDDASTDHTPDVIADAARRWPHIRAVLPFSPQPSSLSPQLGWIEARNALLDATDSDWLFWLDSDDVLAEYNAHLLREIAERSERSPVVKLQLTELWGDLHHTTGRLRHYDRCHVFTNRARLGTMLWLGGSAAYLSVAGLAASSAKSQGPLLFHIKGVKPDRRLVERQFVRGWMRARRPGRLADWLPLADLSAEEVHARALRMLLKSKQDRIRPYPADGPALPAVIAQAPQRFEMVYRDGLLADRLDRFPNWPEGGA